MTEIMGKKISCTLYMLADNKSDVQSGYKIIIIQVIKTSKKRDISDDYYCNYFVSIKSITLLMQPSMFRYSNCENLPISGIPISSQYFCTTVIFFW